MAISRFIYTNVQGRRIEFSIRNGYIITSIDGMSSNTIDYNETSVANQIGSTISTGKVKPKDISIEGGFLFSKEKRMNLINTILPNVEGILRYINEEDGIDVYLNGRPTITPNISTNRIYQKFEFTFHCPFPYWRKYNEGSVEFVRYESKFRLPRSFSGTVPWKISDKIVNQLTTIDNTGSVSSGFVCTILAKDVVKGPELLKVNTQEIMEFPNLVMQLDDVLEISTIQNQRYTRLIRGEIVENVFFETSFESTFFQLDVGSNPLRFDASEGVENMEVTIEYQTTYAGV